MLIIPSIDLRGGKVVRLKQGDYTQQLSYDVDPAETARGFARGGATWMHVVDLDGAREGRPAQLELITSLIRATELKVQVGGGVRSTEDVRRLIDAGAARIVVGTRGIEDLPWFERLVHDPAFADRIVLALDARDGIVATRGWTNLSDRRATEIAAQVSDWPLAAILYTDVAKDGMMSGPNCEQVSAMAQSTKVALIASGGVGSIEHVRRLATTGASAAIIGRSLYEGAVDLSEAIRVAGARS